MDRLMELKAKNPKLRIYATDGDFHQYVLDTMEEGAASNGFFGLVFASEKCDKVTLYGFHKVRDPAVNDASPAVRWGVRRLCEQRARTSRPADSAERGLAGLEGR
jgi:hypothetical protein